jgi:hypothetical protein
MQEKKRQLSIFLVVYGKADFQKYFTDCCRLLTLLKLKYKNIYNFAKIFSAHKYAYIAIVSRNL